MKFGVIVFPGSNCDHDCFNAVKNAIKQPVEYIWHTDTKIDNFDCIILPGGFSYGDYLRCGAIARFAHVMDALKDFSENCLVNKHYQHPQIKKYLLWHFLLLHFFLLPVVPPLQFYNQNF